ncbi:fumarate reductase subunit D (plasmid) [Rhodococcus oxybenzonivorans]|uniref:Fumarate reductase subunit D n=1 Tax=Rhodococcus oxybenzonivorans TaxID=1990687 RepID=A0A2S2C6G2_9NOCA|nr:fumarate reductase subunit FrdD [Rhodococcus oxybenzonivorans]AWK76455.1 fumarate reductase subunit D [Rhodococcus oxybenzonivorans]
MTAKRAPAGKQSTPRSLEPAAWLLFSAGGMIAALLIPVLLVLFGIAIPLGWLAAPDHSHLLSVLHHPVTLLVLFGLCVSALFHWAHRFRSVLSHGLRLERAGGVIAVLCYGGAVVGSVVAAYVLISAW